MKTNVRAGITFSLCAFALLTPQLSRGPMAADVEPGAPRGGAAIADAKKTAANALAWTEWELSEPTYPGLKKAPYLKFAENRLSASAGCNTLGGGIKAGEGKLSVEPLMSTMMAGEEAVMQAEFKYSAALQGAKAYELSADGKSLTLTGTSTLKFRFTGGTPAGFVRTETRLLMVAPALGPQMDGDREPKYLQLEDLSRPVSWGRFTEARILDFDFKPGTSYEIRVAVERNARTGEKQLRLLEVVKPMPAAKP